MENSEFFKKTMRRGAYTICVEGERFLAVNVTRNDCPILSFFGETNLSNPDHHLNNPDYPLPNKNYSFFESRLVVSQSAGNLNLLMSSPRERTIIMRIPLKILDSVMNEARDCFKQAPDGLIKSFQVRLSDLGCTHEVSLLDQPGHSCCHGGRGFQMKNLANWIMLKNCGARPPQEREDEFILELRKYIRETVSKMIKDAAAALARKEARENHIPSESDEPAFLFYLDGIHCAISGTGKSIIYGIGGSDNCEAHIADMTRMIQRDYWQYRIVVAAKDNPETIAFLDRFVTERRGDQDLVRFLQSVRRKWFPQKAENSGRWVMVGC